MFKKFIKKITRPFRPKVIDINLHELIPAFTNGYNKEELKVFENTILSSDLEFMHFGFIDLNDDKEIPKFFFRPEMRDEEKADMMFMYAPTPKLLSYCVKHLTNTAKQDEASDLSYFKCKCNVFATISRYQDEDWDKTITELVNYMAHVEKADNTSENC